MSGFRLSPQQKHLFRLGSGFASNAGRTLGLAKFEGEFDVNAIEQSLMSLVERYEILRTVFPSIAGLELPLQTPLDSTRVELFRHNSRDTSLDAIIQSALSRPFDLSNLPLQRLDVIEVDTTKRFLLWSQPALCGDATSMIGLMRELGAHLTAPRDLSSSGGEPLQYADIAEWLTEILEGDDAEEGLSHWRRQLSEIPAFTLPFADRGPGHSFLPDRTGIPLEPATTEALREASVRLEAPLESILEAAWAIVLSRYGDSDRLIVGKAVDGRSHEDLNNAVGLFAKHLPIGISCNSSETLKELSARLDSAHNDAADWQEYFCWDHLERTVQAGHTLQLPYLYEHTELPLPVGPAGPGLTIERVESQFDHYAVKLSTRGNSEDYGADLWFDSGRFERAPMQRMAQSLGALLQDIALRPQAEIGSLQLTAPEESRRVLFGLNPKREDSLRENSVLELIASQAATHGDAIAVSCGAEQLTYTELWSRANSIAHHLQSSGIGRESLVAICSERAVEMVAAILGVLRAGAAYLPIDPGYPAERREFMLRDARVSAVLTQSRLAGLFAENQDVIELEKIARDAPVTELDTGPERDQLAYVIYTSGSTGRPKGVAVSHGNILASTAARFSFYDESPERFLLLSSYAFDSSMVGLFWTLSTGGTLQLPREGDEQDIVLLSQMIENGRVTHTLCLPTLYSLLLDQSEAAQLASIRTVIVAGETCPAGLVHSHFQIRPESTLVNEYGPTEATVWATAARMSIENGENRVPIGRPVGNTSVYLLDDSMQPVPAGVAGEIYLGGPAVTRGYLDRPGQTAERFVPDPFSGDPGARLYRTGDRARYDQNNELEFLGRVDHQVKIRGYRIEPEEIETRLAAHPAVQQAAVVAMEDHAGGLRLVAYYSANGESSPALPEILDFLRERLPDWMIPAAFVALDAFPLMPNGKIDREALPDPGHSRPNVGAEFVEPAGPLEAYLAERWRDILHADTVGALDNFFELGGNSIQAAIFMNRLRGDLGEFIHVGKLFENPTIRALAGYLEAEHALASGQLVAGGQASPQSPIQPAPEQRALEELGDLSDEEVASMLDELLPQKAGRADQETR